MNEKSEFAVLFSQYQGKNGCISTRRANQILRQLGHKTPNPALLEKYLVPGERAGLWQLKSPCDQQDHNDVHQTSSTEQVHDVVSAPLNVVEEESVVSNIPNEIPNFVSTPLFNQLKKFVKSKMFMTVYITGESGNGKTATLIQACALANREFFRVNINEGTNEHDLLGSYTLINGETVWKDGPVVRAMKNGGVLLLDEVDLGTPKLLCLQPILEGSSWRNPKTGEIVSPAAGFQIFATANTKGQLSNRSAKYVGTRSQNEAFLDRFDFTVDHDYASSKIEKEIVIKNLEAYFNELGDAWDEQKDMAFVDNLVDLASRSREAYRNESISDLISTRRVKSAAKAYAMYNRNQKKAISMILSRFNVETRKAYENMFATISNVDFGDNEDN